MPPAQHVAPLLRVLSSPHKAYICRQTVPLLFACIESLGGLGYLLNHESEPLNLARLFRDGCVNTICEGTTDVLCTDMLRALKHTVSGRPSLAALDWLMARSTLGSVEADDGPVLEAWRKLRFKVEKGTQESLLGSARNILFSLADMVIAALLLVDVRLDPAPYATAICRQFMIKSFVEND